MRKELENLKTNYHDILNKQNRATKANQTLSEQSSQQLVVDLRNRKILSNSAIGLLDLERGLPKFFGRSKQP